MRAAVNSLPDAPIYQWEIHGQGDGLGVSVNVALLAKRVSRRLRQSLAKEWPRWQAMYREAPSKVRFLAWAAFVGVVIGLVMLVVMSLSLVLLVVALLAVWLTYIIGPGLGLWCLSAWLFGERLGFGLAVGLHIAYVVVIVGGLVRLLFFAREQRHRSAAWFYIVNPTWLAASTVWVLGCCLPSAVVSWSEGFSGSTANVWQWLLFFGDQTLMVLTLGIFEYAETGISDITPATLFARIVTSLLRFCLAALLVRGMVGVMYSYFAKRSQLLHDDTTFFGTLVDLLKHLRQHGFDWYDGELLIEGQTVPAAQRRKTRSGRKEPLLHIRRVGRMEAVGMEETVPLQAIDEALCQLKEEGCV